MGRSEITRSIKTTRVIIGVVLICYCLGGFASILNNPYPKRQTQRNILYASFTERPKTLDPAKAYSSNEYAFIAQIYEPPLQYHYLLRPYVLEALTLKNLPKTQWIKNSKGKIVKTIYTLTINPGIYYQPHPAFARAANGKHYYAKLSEDFLDKHDINALKDFPETGTRELRAADYAYEIKRLASPKVHSPIYGLMSQYIIGFKEFNKKIPKDKKVIDYRQYDLKGVKVLNRYQLQITIKGQYPQFRYWLAMPFFSPIPWEADLFYQQPGMGDRNISLDWYPVGTGPYYLKVNNPNREMVLQKNPYFHPEFYPTEGAVGDKEKGLLKDAGKKLPFVNTVIFKLEKEAIPRWNKFLQGYYDTSGISSDSFDQAIHVDENGNPELSKDMQAQNIKLYTTVSPSIFYLGFNMLDPVIGGLSEKHRKLRQAISIAIDYDEFISIFFNGRGLRATGPLPPGIFGYQPERTTKKNIAYAKRLLAEAGYPNGRDAKTGRPLILNYDVPASSGPDDKARFGWLRKQFSKLGIQINIRATQYNRFQEKMRNGSAQIFMWGWNADYPDPENFLFLLYGPNSKAKFGGENAANYQNPKFDKLFNTMKNLPNGQQRQQLINQMINLVRKDSPWIWGFHPKNFTLSHHWNRITKPHALANNTLKYSKLNPVRRAIARKQWNKSVWWPVLMLIGLLLLASIPVAIRFWQKEHKVPRQPKL